MTDTPVPNEWHQSEEAKKILAEFDAASIMADRFRGYGWDTESLGHHCTDLELKLDDLRDAAIKAFAAAADSDRESDAWFDAEREGELDAPTVAHAIGQARRANVGSTFLGEDR